MLHNSNLVLLVGLREFDKFSPKKVTLWTTEKNSSLFFSSAFSSDIIVAKINKIRMIIGESNYLHIYSTGNMKILHIYEINNICLGKLILSNNINKNVWVCFSCSLYEGEVKIYDALYPSTIKIQIKAHKSPILKLSLSDKGDRLATCSCKGTIIRIFSLPTGEKICTFKRGIKPSFIFSLNFSKDGDKLLLSCDDGTIHLFDIEEEIEKMKNEEYPKGFGKVMYRSLATIASKIIPSEYEDVFGIHEADIHYNGEDVKISNIVGFCGEKIKEAFCFAADGNYIKFNIDYINKKMNRDKSYNINEFNKVDNKAPSIMDSFYNEDYNY
jgi:WD40 repeat protein